MIVGLLIIHIHLNGVNSLKEKRSIVKSVVERLKSRFNVSAVELDLQDSKRAAVVGLSLVSNEGAHVNKQLDTIISFVRADGRFHVGEIEREIFYH